MRTATLRTTSIMVVVLATLAGCSTYTEAMPHPDVEVCASAGELFSGPAVTSFGSSGTPATSEGTSPQRLSEPAEAQLRNAVPPELRDDIDTLREASADTSAAEERLQEWAIRACGIEVAFASDGTASVAELAPNDILISGDQRTTISITGNADDALAACEAEVKRSNTPSVLVLDQFGTAIVEWEGQGPCAVIDTRP